MRKKRSDSGAVKQEALQNVLNGVPASPDYVQLDDEAKPFWEAIISTKLLDMWTSNDLVLAANLARIYVDIEYFNKIIATKNRVGKYNDRFEVSAFHKVLVDLQAQAIVLSKLLQIHPRATHGEAKEQKHRNRAHKEAMMSAKELQHERLFAKPAQRH